MHTKLPLKIAFRMVGSSYVATVVDLEEKTQGLELASLARSVAELRPDLADKWRSIIREIGVFAIEHATGGHVDDVFEVPASKNPAARPVAATDGESFVASGDGAERT